MPIVAADADLARVLRTARVHAGFSQAEAAKRIGVSRNTIINWENEGGGTTPSGHDLARLAKAYDFPAELVADFRDLGEHQDRMARSQRIFEEGLRPRREPEPPGTRELSAPARRFLYAFLAELAAADAPEQFIDHARRVLTKADNYTFAADGTRQPMSEEEELMEIAGLAEGLRIIARHKGIALRKLK